MHSGDKIGYWCSGDFGINPFDFCPPAGDICTDDWQNVVTGYPMCTNFRRGGGKTEGRKRKRGAIVEGDGPYLMVATGGTGRGVLYKPNNCWRRCYCEVIYIRGPSNRVTI